MRDPSAGVRMSADNPLGAGTMVKSDRVHGVFGVVTGVRPQSRIGRGWGKIEYNVTNHHGTVSSWVDENQVTIATLDDVVDHFQSLMKSQEIQHRLEYLRGEIEAERISYSEIAELQDYAEYIDPGDVQLLEWAGIPEVSE